MTVLSELARLRVTIVSNALAQQQELARLRTSLHGMVGVNKEVNKSFVSTFNALTQGITGAIVKVFILQRAIRAAVGIGAELVKTAADIEDGFLFVERIQPSLEFTNFRDETIKLAESLRRIDVSELQKIQQTAARMGLRGVQDINSFSETIAKFALVTQESADQVAADFGKILRNSGVEDMQRSVQELSDVMLVLDKSFNVTAPQIAQIARRITAFGQVMGFSTIEVLALSAAGLELGQTAQITGSSFQRLMKGIITNVDDFRNAAGLTQTQLDEFLKLLEADPKGGLVAFLGILQRADPAQAIRILEAVETAGARAVPVVTALSKGLGQLQSAFKIAFDAITSNETENQYKKLISGMRGETTELAEQWKLLKKEIGETPILIAIVKDSAESVRFARKHGFLHTLFGGVFTKDSPLLGPGLEFGGIHNINRFANLARSASESAGGVLPTSKTESELARKNAFGNRLTQDQVAKLKEAQKAWLDAGIEAGNKVAQAMVEAGNKNRERDRQFKIREEFIEKRRLLARQFDITGTRKGGTFSAEGFQSELINRMNQLNRDKEIRILEDLRATAEKELRVQEEIKRRLPMKATVE